MMEQAGAGPIPAGAHAARHLVSVCTEDFCRQDLVHVAAVHTAPLHIYIYIYMLDLRTQEDDHLHLRELSAATKHCADAKSLRSISEETWAPSTPLPSLRHCPG